MEPNVQPDQLRKLSKDEQSFEKLKKMFNKIIDEKNRKEHSLQLLESAIKGDYDSILITELNLEKPGPKIVYVNEGFCKMTGYTKEEVIGKTPRILQGPQTDRAVLDRLKRQLSEGKSFFGQAVNYKKDGSEFVNQWDVHPLTDSEGNITHWVSYQHDITERKRAEKVLIDTQVEFDGLREASQRTVLDVDFQGNIVMANKSFRELTGFAKDELKKKKAWDLFPKKYRDSLRSRFEKKKEEENFSNQQFRGIIRHRTGVPVQIEGKTRILDLKDRILIRAEINNISLQKRVMETLQKRNKDFSTIFEKASEFTYQLVVENGKFRFESLSEEFPEVTGLSPEVIKPQDGIREFVHVDDIEKVEQHFRKICEVNSCTCEYRIRNRDGDYIKIIDYGKLQHRDPVSDTVYIRGAISLNTESGPDLKSQSIR